MSSKSVCVMAHTPIAPNKNRIRRDMLKTTNKRKDLITISHGLFDMLQALEWKGRIIPCDIDPGVRETIAKLRAKKLGRSEYPDLRIEKPGISIESTVSKYCAKFGASNLGIVDIDLACSLINASHIFTPVLDSLIENDYRGRTFITFCARDFILRDKSIRENWLRNILPKEVKIESITFYNSLRIGPRGERHKGSPMYIVCLKHFVLPKRKRK